MLPGSRSMLLMIGWRSLSCFLMFQVSSCECKAYTVVCARVWSRRCVDLPIC